MSTEHTNTPRADSPQSAAEAVRGARQHSPVATPAVPDPMLELAQATERTLRIPAHSPVAMRDNVTSLERRLIGGQRAFRLREVATAGGVSLHSARKLWRAIGFPELSD